MSDILCITNRKLCREDFLVRLESIAAARPAGIVLREKDLTEWEYQALAAQVMEICGRYHVLCILHSFVRPALMLQADSIHLPLPLLRALTPEEKAQFSRLGASCHSTADALEAQRLGCTYITAGHVFDTDCKKGMPGRGLPFLREICQAVALPVYAIGGIDAGRVGEARRAGAAGVCMMSSLMRCENVHEILDA